MKINQLYINLKKNYNQNNTKSKTVMSQFTIKLVLKFLKDNGFIQSFLLLEKESHCNYEEYSKQLAFFRRRLIEGDFIQAIKFLTPFESKLSHTDYKTIVMKIYRQKLFELVENPDENELRQLLENQLIRWCTAEQYQELFHFLEVKSMSQLEQYANWTIPKGRLHCFEFIKPYIQLIESKIIHTSQNDDLNLQEIINTFLKAPSTITEKSDHKHNFNINYTLTHQESEEQKQPIVINQKSLLLSMMNNNKSIKKQQEASESKPYQKLIDLQKPPALFTFNNNNNQQFIKNPKAHNNIINLQDSKLQPQAIRPRTNSNEAPKNINNNNNSIVSSNNNQSMKSSKSNQIKKSNAILLDKQEEAFNNIGQSDSKLLEFSESQRRSNFLNNIEQNSQQLPNLDQIPENKSYRYEDNSSNVALVVSPPPIQPNNIQNTTEKKNNNSEVYIKESSNNNRKMSASKSIKGSNKSNVVVIQSNQQEDVKTNKSFQSNKSVPVYDSKNLGGKPPIMNKPDLRSLRQAESENTKHNFIKKPLVVQQFKNSTFVQEDKQSNLSRFQEIRINNSQVLEQPVINQSKTINVNPKLKITDILSEGILKEEKISTSMLQKSQRQLKFKMIGSKIEQKAIRICQFSESGRYMAIGTNSSYLKIFDVENLFEKKESHEELQIIYEIPNLHLKSIFSLDWSANQRFIVSCSNDATVKLTKIDSAFEKHQTNLIGRHQGSIRMVRFNALENNVISCGQDNLIKIWDINKPKTSQVLKGHYSSVNGIKISENESASLVYSISKDCTIRLWDLRSGDLEAISKPHESQMTYIARDTENLVISHKNGTVSFYNKSLVLQNNYELHEDEIRSIQAAPFEKYYITSSFDGQVCIFNRSLQDNSIVKRYQRHNLLRQEDKVVFATFHGESGYASCSTFGFCNLYAIL